MPKYLIKGGRIVDASQGLDKVLDILIEGDEIVKIGASLESEEAEMIPAEGKWVLPGLIDMHTHLREPGYEYKETIATGTRAAAMGGFTAIACMPNTKPLIDNQSVVELIKLKAKAEGKVKVYPIGSITKESNGEEITEMAELKRSGVVALSDDGKPVVKSDVMRRAMDYAKMLKLPIISHCEDPQLAGEGVMNEGYYSTVLGLKGIPNVAEEVMVARDLLLAELTGCPVHIAHVSTAGSVRLIREAKERGLKVSCEVTPHHFTLTDQAVMGFDTNTKVNPPLRKEKDVDAIKDGLKDGTIDVIATDHAPHAEEEKEVEYNYAPFGMVGLESALALVYQELVLPGVLTPLEAVKKLTVKPAEILNISGGSLKEGSKADLVIFDPELEETMAAENLESKGKNTPFLGWKFKGLPILTMVDGQIVMKDRQIV